MTTWYVAPDAAVTQGLTFASIGTSGYGTTWAKAARWSEFFAASGVWQSYQSGDLIVFLAGYRYSLAGISGGWQIIQSAFPALTMTAQTVGGTFCYANFSGSRLWPWPLTGNTGNSLLGETFLQLKDGSANTNLSWLRFEHIRYPVTPAGSSSSSDLGTLTMDHVKVLNSGGGVCYTQSRNDGRLNLSTTYCESHCHAEGNGRVWGSFTYDHCVYDGELASDNANRNNATPTSGGHSMDNVVGAATTTTPCSSVKTILKNHAAGSSGPGYGQGDGGIGEENAGIVTIRDNLTYGNGDRGWDLKANGTAIRHVSLGDGFSVAHHLDTKQLTAVACVYYAGVRPAGSTTTNVIGQASGLLRVRHSALIMKPTAAQVANNPYALFKGDVDVSKFQASVYGSSHRGVIDASHCYALLAISVGATETSGFTTAADNARVAAIFGLTPGATYNLKARAVGPTGTAGAWSNAVQFVMNAASVGDVSGPIAPSDLAVSAFAATTVTLTWSQVAQDGGTAIQGYVFKIKMPGDAAGVLTLPGKSASPVTLSGLLPATAYQVQIATYDANGNLGAFSSAVNFTTAAGSVSASTPGAPPNPVQAPGWIGHHSLAGLSWGLPTGTVAYYEVSDATDTVIARCLPIPGAGSAATYTKKNLTLVAV